VSQQASVADRIEAFIRTEFDVNPSDNGFGRTVDLFELGYIDSVGFAELLAFLAEEFAVDIPEDDLLSESFTQIDGIAGIVSRLIGSDPRPAPVASGEPTL
jgi:D-alanine--poly(phosphoribitol) ligase subunit 2